MEALYLKKCILENQLPTFFILTGDETLRIIYLNKLKELFNVKPINSIEDYFKIKHSKFNADPTDTYYLIEEDNNIRENKELWNYPFENLILVYPSLDKKDKFYKAYENEVVRFEKVSKEALKGLVRANSGLDEECIEKIVDGCENDYFRLKNELSKVVVFEPSAQTTTFKKMLEANQICNRDCAIGYDFVNAVSDRNKYGAVSLLGKITKNDIIGQLSLCYNNLRTQLLVQGGNQTAEQLGINPKLYYVLSKKRKYTVEELCKTLTFIAEVINKIKCGDISAQDAINLFVIQCL